MPKFRKRPVEIEAMQYREGMNSRDEIVEWSGGVVYQIPGALYGPGFADRLLVRTLEGAMTVSPGDWVIRGVVGEFYPCKPDIFDLTYEAV